MYACIVMYAMSFQGVTLAHCAGVPEGKCVCAGDGEDAREAGYVCILSKGIREWEAPMEKEKKNMISLQLPLE